MISIVTQKSIRAPLWKSQSSQQQTTKKNQKQIVLFIYKSLQINRLTENSEKRG